MNLREIILANRKLKLLSLLAAVVLWLFVTLETRDEAALPLVLRPVNLPAGLIVKPELLPLLQLRVSGPRTLIIRQQLQGVFVDLDLARAVAGTLTLSGLERSVRLVPGLHPVTVTPAAATITLLENDGTTKK